MTGQTISRYRILEKLGEGGMGVVYKAEDLKLRRTVALKFLPPHATEDRERFLREAQAAASLNHPNICTIHEIDEEHGFIAMELIEGESLKERIAQRPLPLDEALDIVIHVCTGLQTAHDKGVVHRDIKPANIMVTLQGLVKIMDFGLAQISDDTRITRSGVTIGTPAYMSPEQARGDPTDRRTDLWAVGVLLYEMLAGRTPFKGTSSDAVTYNVIHSEPEPLTALRTGLPTDIDRIVSKALRKDPAGRYQSAADLIVDLRNTTQSEPARLKHSSRRWAWLVLLPILLAGLYVIFQKRPAPENGAALGAIPLTTVIGVKRYPSLSPDGNHVVFTWTGPKQDNPDIYIQQIGAGSPLRLTEDPLNDYSPVWSPDGRNIAFLRRRAESGISELLLKPPLAGPERKITELSVNFEGQVNPPFLSWCPDSTCLVATDSTAKDKPSALFRISVETGEKKPLTNPQLPATGDTNPAVSPDGRSLVFRRSIARYSGELYMLSLGDGFVADGEPQRLTPASLDAAYPAWMPGGKEIVFSAKESLWRMTASAAGKPARLPFVGEDGLMPAVSRSQPGRPSRLIYIRSFIDGNIWRVETSAAGAPVTSPPAGAVSSTRYEGMPGLSPDGRRLAFSSRRSGSGEIWVSDPDGGNAMRLTFLDARATGAPQWSPDGKWIVFHSAGDVHLIPATGGRPQNLTSHPALDSFPSFSHDAKWIYFNSNRSGENRIWKIPASGGESVPVLRAGRRALASRDGVYLYYVASTDVPSSLWRAPVAGGEAVKILDGVVLANFAVLERGIYYIDRPTGERGLHYFDRPSGETRLQFFDFSTQKSTIVARNLGDVDLPIAASRDGRKIYYSRMESPTDELLVVENFH